MVTGNVRRAAGLLAALFILAPMLYAELSTTAKVSGTTAVLHEEAGQFSLLSIGQGRLDFKSFGNRNVKGQFQLDALISDDIVFDVPRAYLKVRFPFFRVTLGKTRVSWGEGFLFNAGDVIFSGMSILGNLTAAELRDETDWMLVPYLPLGTFSYIEGVLLPHPTGTGPPVSIKLHEVDAGIRVQTKLVGHKLEAGYLYSGSNGNHRPYVSVKGNLLNIDWHLSSALSIPVVKPDEEDLKKGWDISFGLFRMVSLPAGPSLLFRLESGINPFGHWEEIHPSPADADYGIYLYPEVSLSPSDAASIFLRTIISPVDLSALMSTGLSWNIYQGFTMHFFFAFLMGDGDDHFSWGKTGDLSFTTKLEYVYGTSR